MYVMNEKCKEIMKIYKIQEFAKVIGINDYNLSDIMKKNKPCLKQTAYCITKLINSDKEISDFFDYIEKE